jgi:hypothetical protein
VRGRIIERGLLDDLLDERRDKCQQQFKVVIDRIRRVHAEARCEVQRVRNRRDRRKLPDRRELPDRWEL